MTNDCPKDDHIYSVLIGDHQLEFYSDCVCFGGSRVKLDKIEYLRIVRTNTYVNGAWVHGKRVIRIGAVEGQLEIDCSRAFPDREQIDRAFLTAMAPIFDFVGSRLIATFLSHLAKGETFSVGGVKVTQLGAWVEGNWQFLWWKAPPRLVPWDDLKIWSDEGVIHLTSKRDLRFRSNININSTDNAVILDHAIRLILEKGIWKAWVKQSTK